MSGKGRCVDKRIQHTVAYLLRCPTTSVPEAMRACKFSDKESSNAGKQMAVRRAREKAASGKRIPPPPNVIDTSTVGVSTVSPITGANSTRSPVAIVTATAAAMTATRRRRNDATTNQRRDQLKWAVVVAAIATARAAATTATTQRRC